MTLATISVPTPAAGTDWSATVPGQYVWNVQAIRATLAVAPTAPQTAIDSSGNGHNLGYSTFGTKSFGAVGPFGGAPNSAVSIDEGLTTDSRFIATSPAESVTFQLSPITIETWAYASGVTTPLRRLVSLAHAPSAVTSPWQLAGELATGTWQSELVEGSATNIFSSPNIATATWHHIALTWDGATWTLYTDGVSVATHAGAGPVYPVSTLLSLGGFQIDTTPFGTHSWSGRQAGVAIYGAALTAPQIAAHFAAKTSAANYRAAVLADTPVGFWMLDEAAAQLTRAVMLDVTDGTNLVTEIPPGQPVVAATSRTYSWVVPNSSGNTASSESVQIISIPELTLPAGYRIGTRTPDLAATDQWSAITIYVDQRDSDSAGGPGRAPDYRSLLLLG